MGNEATSRDANLFADSPSTITRRHSVRCFFPALFASSKCFPTTLPFDIPPSFLEIALSTFEAMAASMALASAGHDAIFVARLITSASHAALFLASPKRVNLLPSSSVVGPVIFSLVCPSNEAPALSALTMKIM